MKVRQILVGMVLCCGISVEAFGQSRKYISQFTQFQSYYNPGLTGYEGSALRGFVRNQWSGVEGAPKTRFLSIELDFGELGGLEDPALMGKNAVSLNMLHDTYGAFMETELIGAYASRIRITDRHNVRLGAGVNYLSVRLDGNALTVEQAQDASIGQYLGSFANMQIIDFNLGLALTHEDYYISYGMHHVNGGRLSSGDDFMNGQPMSIMVQTGYRYSFSESVTGIGNFFYRKQEGFADNTEINLKALMLDTFWVGAGHRLNYANSLHVGYLGGAIRLGYVYEYPINSSRQFLGNTHEFMVMFRFFDQQGPGGIW
ncbi:PorP/SprF family type IX secretion system membrane protein [Lunatimonas salinarum]|uniref:PorP/SprF family type IX secretion system membrane protein n=1 Tax=Lunatimonas salinarum TaxID=1774590 RepID=UPI001ADEE96A|nr:type IX secretion system membrane protein PorP/SprF [Lunatimonas salinarum]